MATRIPANNAAFTVGEILDATGGVLSARGSADRATSVWTNTRDLLPGAAFVALVGKAHDGHAFINAAAGAGAPIAIVEREVDAPPGMTIVRVESTLRALADLARMHVARWHALGDRTVIGITGSAGKTTTRVATAALVESLFPGKVVATRGNLNNRIGVPMMLFSLAHEHRIAVLELGTSERGEIAELCRMAQPDVGILTLIAAAHVEGLGSLEGVAMEKAALYRSLSRTGIAVGNGDDARVRAELASTTNARQITYGRSAGSDARILARTPIGMTSSRVEVSHAGGRRSAFETPLVGEAGALACAAAIAAIEAAFDVELDSASLTEAFRKVDVSEQAQRLIPLELTSGLIVIDDAYNANPASVVSSIRAAAEMAFAVGRPLVLVLGEMCELGDLAAWGHEEVGRAAGASGARLVIAVGGGEARRIADNARAAGIEALFVPSVDNADTVIAEALRESDLVLVKGSRAAGTERIVAELIKRDAPRPHPR